MFRPLLVGLTTLVLTACAMPQGAYGPTSAPHNANLCPMIGELGATLAWPHMHRGTPVEDVLDALDARFAGRYSTADQRTAFYARWATQYVYYHPHWTQAQARVGVEQACLRAAYR